MDTKISTFQPIGDAATELRAAVAGLDHAGALNVLQHTETVGESWVHGHHVTFKAYEGWTVTPRTKGAKPVRDITVTVSQPYHVEGYHGSHYGISAWTRRDYTTTVDGRAIKQNNKAEITTLIRQLAYREGFRANITFVSEESA